MYYDIAGVNIGKTSLIQDLRLRIFQLTISDKLGLISAAVIQMETTQAPGLPHLWPLKDMQMAWDR